MDAKLLVKKFDSMNQYAIGNWKTLWQECADWCLPTNDNINRVRYEGMEKSPQRMIDICIQANHNFAAGFYSHMFPQRHPKSLSHSRMEFLVVSPKTKFTLLLSIN